MKVRLKMLIVLIIIGFVSISLDVWSSLLDYSKGFSEVYPITTFMFSHLGMTFTFVFGYLEFSIAAVAVLYIYGFLNHNCTNKRALTIFFVIMVIVIISHFFGHLIGGIENLWYNGF